MNNKYNLLPLYPQSNDIYDNEADLLFQSFADPKIKNIGIVAPYGAGKSSLIETFKQKYSNKKISNISPKLRFLDLTLASFNSESQIDSSKELNACSKGENFNNSMEKSILQQMLYKKEKKIYLHLI